VDGAPNGPWRFEISELEPGSADYEDTLTFDAWCREHPERARELFGPGEPRRGWPLPDLAVPQGRSLRVLTEQHGWTVTLADPDGVDHSASLERWRSADPDRTYLRLTFERSVTA